MGPELRTLEPALHELRERIASREATVGVIGLGAVGFAVARAAHAAGHPVLGHDIDEDLVSRVGEGTCPHPHMASPETTALLESERFEATSDPARLSEAEVILICVSTPLDAEGAPDLSAVEAACDAVAASLQPGRLVVLESTTWPGTTREVVLPRLQASGLTSEEDFALAYSPEREDPGHHSTEDIPRLVAGLDEASLELALLFYAAIVPSVHPVETLETAECAKLFENTFRSVNIALVNELKDICDGMGVDARAVIRASATKPFGFMPFEPGPGPGGHCIPIDPQYLAWAARKAGKVSEFVELATRLHQAQPLKVVEEIREAVGGDLTEKKVLLLGIAYKPGVASTCESPALVIAHELTSQGALVSFSDPFVRRAPSEHASDFVTDQALPLDAETLRAQDVCVLVTNHMEFDYELVVENAVLLVDTRGVTVGTRTRRTSSPAAPGTSSSGSAIHREAPSAGTSRMP